MISVGAITLTPSIVETQQAFVISVEVISFSVWKDVKTRFWSYIKTLTWGNLYVKWIDIKTLHTWETAKRKTWKDIRGEKDG